MGITYINVDLSLPDNPVVDDDGKEVTPESRLLTPAEAGALRPAPVLTHALVDALNVALVAGAAELTVRTSLGIAEVAQSALDAKGWGVSTRAVAGATTIIVSDPKAPPVNTPKPSTATPTRLGAGAAAGKAGK